MSLVENYQDTAVIKTGKAVQRETFRVKMVNCDDVTTMEYLKIIAAASKHVKNRSWICHESNFFLNLVVISLSCLFGAKTLIRPICDMNIQISTSAKQTNSNSVVTVTQKIASLMFRLMLSVGKLPSNESV